MHCWRVSEHLYLNGYGGVLAAGRWHSGGTHVLYTAEHSALALLEVLIQTERRTLPPPYQLLQIEIPDVEPVHFGEIVPSEAEARAWGDRWLKESRSLLARVPSAVAPEAYNILINPRHPDGGNLRLLKHERYQWDARLFR